MSTTWKCPYCKRLWKDDTAEVVCGNVIMCEDCVAEVLALGEEEGLI